MAIDNYGVWAAKPCRVNAERATEDPNSPHIHLYYDDGSGGNFNNTRRASINVKSGSELSELVFWLVRDFEHPITDGLKNLSMGFHQIASSPGGIALDYIRGNMIKLEKGMVLKHDVQGERNDIIDYVMPELEAAINRDATIYLFGEPYDDMQGIHDVHMNQGSKGGFAKYNGVWQDGGIIIYFPDEDRFDAIFLAFASQAVHTDQNGDSISGSKNFKELIYETEPIPEPEPETIIDELCVAIIGALVNPIGNENQPDAMGKAETVYLINRSTEDIDIKGWGLSNKSNEKYVISDDILLKSGEVRTIILKDVPLSNQGGLISLFDKNGIKIDGVSYTKKQAKKEGEVIIFR